MSTATRAIIAEEFARMPLPENPCELIRGEIVEMNPPKPRHGKICSTITSLGRRFNEDHDCLHVLCNDTGIITERNPDTVRGPDVWFITYDRLPKGQLSQDSYLEVVPEIAFEVVSTIDRWSELSKKITEYLTAGVLTVCVLEPDLETIPLYFPDHTSRTLSADDTLTFPEILPEFAVAVKRYFE